jgi:hypothetical protein
MFTDPALPAAARIWLPLVVFRSRASGWVEGAWRETAIAQRERGQAQAAELVGRVGWKDLHPVPLCLARVLTSAG